MHYLTFNESSGLHSENHTDQSAPTIKQWFLTAIVVCFILTFLIGCIGNTLLFYVIHKRKERTRTIHVLTLNLAVSDLIVLLIYLPMQVYQIQSLMTWELGRVSCKLFYGINAATINANILTLIAITRDRYVAVTDPLTSHSQVTSSVKKWLLLIWSISVFLTLPLLIVVDANKNFCYESWPDVRLERAYWIILFKLQLVCPFSYFTFAYSKIVYRMRTVEEKQFSAFYDSNQQCNFIVDKRAEKRKRQQVKLLRLAIILVVAYAICVTPQHGVFFAYTYGTLTQNPNAVYIFIISNFLLIFNSLINPVVYASQSNEMQRLIQKLLCYQKVTVLSRKKETLSVTRTYSATSNNSTASSF